MLATARNTLERRHSSVLSLIDTIYCQIQLTTVESTPACDTSNFRTAVQLWSWPKRLNLKLCAFAARYDSAIARLLFTGFTSTQYIQRDHTFVPPAVFLINAIQLILLGKYCVSIGRDSKPDFANKSFKVPIIRNTDSRWAGLMESLHPRLPTALIPADPLPPHDGPLIQPIILVTPPRRFSV
ncbi:uncharacterized protein BO96DRAFT_466358 [Aspergillus niger CBS 101883]|uniref:Uncharacterized protein n=3 Tax=Aspergillus niger TaxID=5061 RepID=A2RBE9_ASPNC|nr:uncharacterized protein BO96DRAFT_466358 [Aspergillus niger CBS 101883]XP_059605040.1 hypothetical protein An18g06485 [Aspergillus niger]PYH56449.1 hypothetical protein BO96DRAFT_466358 [Aspergillus niger CBS 101883]RDH23388.1 hypothetical protein M747DRAFT_231014 [Aspergillus niger ATCC 13496]CAK47316.1 hypothetical protein An18g06485 [Aspergillus niger]